MKIQSIDILGKKYRIQSDFKNEEIDGIRRDINSRLKMLIMEYPNLDRIDILILYIIELQEKINLMEKKRNKENEKLAKISQKLYSIEKKIKNEIEKIDIT